MTKYENVAEKLGFTDYEVVDKDGKMVGIDMLHCKGCGICANECPVNKNAKRIDAITMKLESDFK